MLFFVVNGRSKVENSSGDHKDNMFLERPWSWGGNLGEVEGNNVFWFLQPAEHRCSGDLSTNILFRLQVRDEDAFIIYKARQAAVSISRLLANDSAASV